ncbi:MAG TPA: Gfo/Idh/MocA family oxidoreductase [Planctomycetaceae bacterium]|nr:Gfo/Idh/MocA family oxidoreductase [Planctomycetaceae bacterium]
MATGSSPIRIAIIGAGAVSDYHHVPGIDIDSRAKLVAICDASEELLDQRSKQWGVEKATTDYEALCTDPDIDAVIIATPNFTHKEIALAAARNGKHIMCEKPLGLSGDEVREMRDAAIAAGIVHMTAFSYRFAPSMRYIRHLVTSGDIGTPRHFRSQRFLDWPETSWGWRQYQKTAGAGNLFDMTIHRIDFAMDLMGKIDRLCGGVARFCPREVTSTGEACPPSDVDDWSALIGIFENGGVGVWEGTTVAKGYDFNGFGHELAEINGSTGTVRYCLHEPNKIWIGKTGQDVAPLEVPHEYLKPQGSPRDPALGKPADVFRYDLVWEFCSAIYEGRDAVPSFDHGLNAQLIADAVLQSNATGSWIDVADRLV